MLQAATSAFWPKVRIDMQTVIPMTAAVAKTPARNIRHRQEAASLEIETEEVAAYDYQDAKDYAAPSDAEEQSSEDQMITLHRGDEGVFDALGPHVEQENIGHIHLGHLQNGKSDGAHQQEGDHRLIHLQKSR